MSYSERALTFACAAETLVGILSIPNVPATTGAIILVGGPQYRVGSHRQFALLSRYLAARTIAVLRFDYRGMGDSTGSPRSFEDVGDDIAAAIDAMQVAVPTVQRIVLFGLCDAASAALTYWDSTRDSRVVAMVLLNPWVRSPASAARTQLKHYYLRRLLQRTFWQKLVAGGVAKDEAIRGVKASIAAARSGATARTQTASRSFQDRMASGLASFDGQILLILSGRDLTAKEFLEYTNSDALWRGLLSRPRVACHDIDEADHTFSSDQLRTRVESLIFAWIERHFPLPRSESTR